MPFTVCNLEHINFLVDQVISDTHNRRSKCSLTHPNIYTHSQTSNDPYRPACAPRKCAHWPMIYVNNAVRRARLRWMRSERAHTWHTMKIQSVTPHHTQNTHRTHNALSSQVHALLQHSSTPHAIMWIIFSPDRPALLLLSNVLCLFECVCMFRACAACVQQALAVIYWLACN